MQRRMFLNLGAATLAAGFVTGAGCASGRAPAPAAMHAPSAAADEDALARGQRVLGGFDPEAPARVMQGYAQVAPEFGRYVIEYPFGEIYADDTLDARTRLLTAIAALSAIGDSDVPLGHHIRYALNAGCTREEVVATIVQTSIYAGFPRTVRGLNVAEQVFEQHAAGDH